MIAKLNGNTAPPRPWTPRKPISDQMFHAAAAPTQPMKKSVSETTSRRSLPCWSPSFPRIGVVTAETSRNAVKTQVAHAFVVWKSSRNAGRAGRTIVCISA
jgi:hypothetical protein